MKLNFNFNSYISGISILGLPAEMYVYGTQYSMIVLSEVLVSITMVYVYLPVFYKLQITSSYEVCLIALNKLNIYQFRTSFL